MCWRTMYNLGQDLQRLQNSCHYQEPGNKQVNTETNEISLCYEKSYPGSKQAVLDITHQLGVSRES